MGSGLAGIKKSGDVPEVAGEDAHFFVELLRVEEVGGGGGEIGRAHV